MKMRTKMIVKGENGVAAIEMAIVLPLLVVLLFGIVEFSIALYDKAMITNASREGARAGIVFKDANTPRLTEAEITEVVNNYCEAHLITFEPGNPPITTAVHDDIDGQEDVDYGEPLTVTVTYRYNFLVLPNFLSSSFKKWLDLKAITVMRYE